MYCVVYDLLPRRFFYAKFVINIDILRKKAEFFVKSFNVNNFKTFNSWISNFKKYYNIKEYVKWNEAASTPLETLDDKRQRLHEIIKDYNLNDVFNCDKTGKVCEFFIEFYICSFN